MSEERSEIEIRFTNGRCLRVAGRKIGTTHKDFGHVLYLRNAEDTRRIFLANSFFVDSAVKVDSPEDAIRRRGASGNGKERPNFRIVLKDGTSFTSAGTDCLTNHRDFGCKAFTLDDTGERTFECAVENLFFMCAEEAILLDSGATIPSDVSDPVRRSTHQLFISHVEEDAVVAIELAQALEQAGFTTWYYERDCLPGPQYLLQVPAAIDQSHSVVVLVSPHSLGSNQVTSEIVRAYETGKSFVPLLLGITHAEFQQRQPVWRQAMGASTSLSLPPSGLASALPRIIAGLHALLTLPPDTSGTMSSVSQIFPPVETEAQRFAKLFAERPDVIAEVEAEASQASESAVAEFERQLLRLEVQVHEPPPPSWTRPEDLARGERLLTLIELKDPELAEARAFVSVTRKCRLKYDHWYKQATHDQRHSMHSIPEHERQSNYDEWREQLDLYRRAIGGPKASAEAIIMMGPRVVPLLCMSFRTISEDHTEYRLEVELARIMSRLKDFRSLPFLASAIVRSQDDMNEHNDWGLGMLRAIQAFGVAQATVDDCLDRLIGISASEILRRKRERDKH